MKNTYLFAFMILGWCLTLRASDDLSVQNEAREPEYAYQGLNTNGEIHRTFVLGTQFSITEQVLIKSILVDGSLHHVKDNIAIWKKGIERPLSIYSMDTEKNSRLEIEKVLSPGTYCIAGTFKKYRFTEINNLSVSPLLSDIDGVFSSGKSLTYPRYHSRNQRHIYGHVNFELCRDSGGENAAPALHMNVKKQGGKDSLCYVFSANASDSDGRVVTVQWNFGDGSGAEGDEVKHRFQGSGNYKVICRAIDNGGAESLQERMVEIRASQQDDAILALSNLNESPMYQRAYVLGMRFRIKSPIQIKEILVDGVLQGERDNVAIWKEGSTEPLSVYSLSVGENSKAVDTVLEAGVYRICGTFAKFLATIRTQPERAAQIELLGGVYDFGREMTYPRYVYSSYILGHFNFRFVEYQGPIAKLNIIANQANTNAEIVLNGASSLAGDTEITSYQFDLNGDGEFDIVESAHLNDGDFDGIVRAQLPKGQHLITLKVVSEGGLEYTVSEEIVVSNSAPVISRVEIRSEHIEHLEVQHESSDLDNDDLSFSITWIRNGEVLETNNKFEHRERLELGDEWKVILAVSDGDVESKMESKTFIVKNSVRQIVVGGKKSYILKYDGSCWAFGSYFPHESLSVYSNVLIENQSTPSKIFTDGVKQMALGSTHMLLVKFDGSMWGTGRAVDGQLGAGRSVRDDYTKLRQVYSGGVQKVAVGRGHSLILMEDGSLWVTGQNQYGQLGDGTKINRDTPVKIVSGGVVDIAAGYDRSYYIDLGGALYGFGSNRKGSLGDGSEIHRSTPVQIFKEGIKNVSVGYQHTLYLKSKDSLWGSGWNHAGQLGLGGEKKILSPVEVIPEGVKNIYAGYQYSIVRKANGSLWATGDNHQGQLGDGSQERCRVFKQVIQEGVRRIITSGCDGSHHIIEKNNGSLWAVGENQVGQLGDGTFFSDGHWTRVGMFHEHDSPRNIQVIPGDSKVTIKWKSFPGGTSYNLYWSRSYPVTTSDQVISDVISGVQHEFLENGRGYYYAVSAVNGTAESELSDSAVGTPMAGIIDRIEGFTASAERESVYLSWSPQKAASMYRIYWSTSADVTKSDPFVLITDHQFRHNGLDNGTCYYYSVSVLHGQIESELSDVVSAKPSDHALGIVKVAASRGSHYQHRSNSYVVMSDGSLWATGDNEFGQLADSTTRDRRHFERVREENILDVDATGESSMLLTSGGLLSRIGRGSSMFSQGDPLADVVDFRIGDFHGLAVKADGSLWGYGYNLFGIFSFNHNEWKLIDSFANGVHSVATSRNHSLILMNNGSLWASGSNWNGQLGDGTRFTRHSPVKIFSNGVKAIACGEEHSLVLRTDGSLWGMGNPGDGRLLIGQAGPVLKPVKLMNGVKQMSAGSRHNLILRDDGSLWAIGRDNLGQLGDGTRTVSSKPIEIFSENVSQISAGGDHNLILKTDGSLWVNGYNDSGQLGDGSDEIRFAPVKIDLTSD